MRRLAGLVVGGLLLHLVLILPNRPAAMGWAAMWQMPLELPLILFALAAVTGRAFVLRIVLVALLTLICLLKLADFGNYIAYNRMFNPATDLGLIRAAFDLGIGSLGPLLGLIAALAAVLVPVLIAALLWWATGRWARVSLPVLWRSAAALISLAALALVAGQIGAAKRFWTMPVTTPGTALTTRLAYDRVELFRITRAELVSFVAAAQSDPFAAASPLLDRLGDKDVVFIFIESYGRASFDNPLYAPTHGATLQVAEAELGAIEGVTMRSGWMTAPIIGGQSWLAHTSVASGLWISDQIRYRALLASPRKTLFDLARAAGYHTTTVVPAITRDWPEGSRIGFETILASDDLGYAGLPFNWVTMPDQFTLAAYDRLLAKAPRDGRPLFSEISLISSHAPWVPVPQMIGWEDVGDGTVFNEMAQSDDPPNVVWQDHERVRDQYRQAIDYALQASLSYVGQQGEDMPLFIILGDHQAAAFVSGSDSFDVPVHVIGPSDLVSMTGQWGWTPGLVPDDSLPAWSMDLFRDRFLRAFSTGVP
ncbi:MULTISPECIES: sulfatase-like hydrolase/transferase [unclassified Yoonia]|uniref:sulfatase-like hydrolase/transferase n=1 Tax=unclassified Yoonia TaxID=2629118 RepID=UPI002B0030A0|nr:MULTISPECIES: sulfatase-like hydrolase/transferase [unclassified Yoonia]